MIWPTVMTNPSPGNFSAEIGSMVILLIFLCYVETLVKL